ncbi:branched-chain amino acid aminotransferase 1, mitochondrial-like [Aristolochia californica]|uniref:branched-chain amino acid aminotransferase 1, mitochondrial-like n=1 Tax=Aristolochia californica TaxID=171875 RepID=UPI0035E12FA1
MHQVKLYQLHQQKGQFLLELLAKASSKSLVIMDFRIAQVEGAIPVDEMMEADEVSCTGTAVVVAPVGSFTYNGKRVEFRTGARTVSQTLYWIHSSIQTTGTVEDKKGWTTEIDETSCYISSLLLIC